MEIECVNSKIFKINRNLQPMKIFDISVDISNSLVFWPGDKPPQIKSINDMHKGDDINLSRLDISAHIGTHMDAPRHFLKEGKSIDVMPLEVGLGKARVIEIEDNSSIKKEELQKHNIQKAERILLKTRNSEQDWTEKNFMYDFVHLETKAAEYLASLKIRLIGIDYLSVSGINKNEHEVHKAFLKNEIWILEGIHLKNVTEGEYELICLPLKLKNCDGAPARAILRKA